MEAKMNLVPAAGLIIRKPRTLVCTMHVNMQAEILVITRGVVGVTVGNRTMEVKKSEVVFIDSLEPHSFFEIEGGKGYVMIFDMSVVPDFGRIAAKNDIPNRKVPISEQTSAFLEGGIPPIGDREVSDTLQARALLYPLILEIMRQNKTLTPKAEQTDYMLKTFRIIADEYASPLTLFEVSRRVGVNYVYLGRVFRQVTGVAFSDLLCTTRINYAMQMLRDGTDSIADIAMECGFGSVRNFNRRFIKQNHCTPREFRRMS